MPQIVTGRTGVSDGGAEEDGIADTDGVADGVSENVLTRLILLSMTIASGGSVGSVAETRKEKDGCARQHDDGDGDCSGFWG